MEWVIVLAVVAFVLLKSAPPDLPAGSVAAGGVGPPPANDYGVAAGIGSMVCQVGPAVVGGVYGGPAGAGAGAAAGKAISPLCAAAAPYVVKGAVYAAKEVAAGAVWGAHQAAAGAQLVGHVGADAARTLSDPVGSALLIPTAATRAAGYTAGIVDRGINATYGALPTPIKIGLAPVLLPAKVTATAVHKAAAVAGKVVAPLSSGAKAAEHAVASGVNKVLGFL